MTLPTTCSGGGPVIVIPIELCAKWRGYDEGSTLSDYDRACESKHLRDYQHTPYGGVGWLEVAGGAALILSCEVDTHWLADPQGGYILRGGFEEEPTEEAARNLIAASTDLKWRDLSLSLQVNGGALVLFDSAFAGAANPDDIGSSDGEIVAKLKPGRYLVSTVTTDEEADIIRLRYTGAAG